MSEFKTSLVYRTSVKTAELYRKTLSQKKAKPKTNQWLVCESKNKSKRAYSKTQVDLDYKPWKLAPTAVAHACNPSNRKRLRQKNTGSEVAWAKYSMVKVVLGNLVSWRETSAVEYLCGLQKALGSISSSGKRKPVCSSLLW